MRKTISIILVLITSICTAQNERQSDQLYNQASQQFELKNYLEAAQLFEQAAELEKQNTSVSKDDLVVELQNAGTCYSFAGERLKAIKLLDEAYNLLVELKKVGEQASVLYSIIEIYQELNIKEKEEEIKYIKKVIELCKESSKTTELVLSYNKLAAIYKDLEQYDFAITYTRLAIPHCSKLSSKRLHAFTKNSHGENLMIYNEVDSAISMYSDAYSLYKEIDLKNDIAVVCNNLGIAYSDKYDYEKALEYNNQAIQLFHEIEDEKGLANSLNNTGKIYENWGKYDEAIQYYEKAIKTFEKIKDYKGMAVVYNNMGVYYFLTSYYNFAFDNYAQALNIYTQLNDNYGIASVKNNIGRLHHNLGNYDQAILEYREAESIYSKEGDIGAIAKVQNNIGGIYNAWARYDSALIYFEKAHDIQVNLNRKSEIAQSLNNIADVYVSWAQYEKAIEKYNTALGIYSEISDRRNKAHLFSNLASVYFSYGKYDLALKQYKEAEALYKEMKDLSGLASVLDNMGSLNFIQKNHKQAAELFENALTTRRDLNEKKGIAESSYHLGITKMELGDINTALSHLEEAVDVFEKLRKTAVGDIRRDFLASQIQVYESIVLCHIKNNDINKALIYNELSRSKSLLEVLSKNNKVEITGLNVAQQNLPEHTTAIVYGTMDNPTLTSMAITKSEETGAILKSKKDLIAEFLKDVDVRSNVISEFNKVELLEVTQFIKSEGTYKLSVSMQKKLFDSFVLTYIELLSRPEMNNKDQVKKLSQELYQLLIKPIEKYIGPETKNLIVVPDGVLSRLPFETLIDDQGKFLVDTYNIGYIHSLSIYKILKERAYESYEKDVLAIGVSNFKMAADTKLPEYEINKDQVSSIGKLANRLSKDQQPLRDIYQNLGLDQLNNIPGSVAEVKRIKEIFPNSDTITNSRASEGRIKYYSSKDNLKKYRILHFSTHGLSVNEIPLLSGLVMYQTKELVNGEDGYLRIDEIADLSIQADLINLSACETGAGKIYSGEGTVGLSQAFIGAGANGITISQWEVDDEASAEFMKLFYEALKTNDFNYNISINEVKRKFIKGEAGIFWKSPMFWAPFMYYGK